MLEFFNPLTSGEQEVVIVSDEDTAETWTTAREETINQVRKNKESTGFATGTESYTSDTSATCYSDMKKTGETQHIPILTDLNALARGQGWEVD
jgi:hypothetical protein